MSGTLAVFKRELMGYFITPVAYVFIVIFLVLTGVFTFSVVSWYEGGQADLRLFFNFHPWLYLFLIPALSMRLWAEERRSGTIEQIIVFLVRDLRRESFQVDRTRLESVEQCLEMYGDFQAAHIIRLNSRIRLRLRGGLLRRRFLDHGLGDFA